MATLSKRIKEFRSFGGITATEAAAKAGMHPVVWSDVERGKNTNPTLRTLRRIADALGVTVGDLVDGTEGR